MLFSFFSGDWRDVVINLLLSLPVIIIALSFHEAAHGYVAYKCGDPTARNLGRLTLNPIKHIDALGLICMLLIGYGWAKPVPINTRNFNNPKRGMAITALAGPAMNLLLGVIGTVLSSFFYAFYAKFYFSGSDQLTINIFYFAYLFFYLFGIYNLILMVFNLIPVPPFDGSRFMLSFLPADKYFGIMRYERQILLGVFIVLLVCSNFFNFSPFSWVADKIYGFIFEPLVNLFLNILF